MTNATYRTTISVDLPDNPLAQVRFTMETDLAAADGEIFPYQRAYRLKLDAAGIGTIDLPTPDNTGAASWSWYVYLPSGGPYLINVPYSAAAQELADLLDDVALSVPAATALLATKANIVPGIAGNLARLIGNGHLEDSGLAAGATGAALLATATEAAARLTILAAALRPTQADIAGTTHTFTTANEGQIVTSQSGSATTFTIPLNSAQAFVVGAIVGVEQHGVGALSVTATAGVTLNGVDGATRAISARWGAAAIRKTGTNAWVIIGAIA